MIKSDLLPYLKIILQSNKFLGTDNEKDKQKNASLLAFSPQEKKTEIKKLQLDEEEVAILLS